MGLMKLRSMRGCRMPAPIVKIETKPEQTDLFRERSTDKIPARPKRKPCDSK